MANRECWDLETHAYVHNLYIYTLNPCFSKKGSKQTCNHTLRLRWCTLVDYHRLFPLILFPPIQPDLLILNRNPAMNIGDVIPAPHTSSSIVGFSRINYQPQLGRTQDLGTINSCYYFSSVLDSICAKPIHL